jgi:hypothetical protein
MKRFLLTLSLALALPAVAFAQQGPPGGGPPPGGPMPRHTPTAAMRADMQQLRQLHEQFRSQVLGALSPAHKQLLAQVAGNLAISASPDPKAAVKQLDGALSASEKTAILNAASSFRDQAKAAFAKMRADSPWPKPSGAPRPHPSHSPRAKRAPDAGAILLMVASGHSGMMMHGPRGGWGPGPNKHAR